MTEQEEKILRAVEDRIEELKTLKQTLIKCQRTVECMELELELVRKQNDRLMTSLKDCANELCLKCGNYRNEHLGHCNGCRWKEVKHWDTD